MRRRRGSPRTLWELKQADDALRWCMGEHWPFYCAVCGRHVCRSNDDTHDGTGWKHASEEGMWASHKARPDEFSPVKGQRWLN